MSEEEKREEEIACRVKELVEDWMLHSDPFQGLLILALMNKGRRESG